MTNKLSAFNSGFSLQPEIMRQRFEKFNADPVKMTVRSNVDQQKRIHDGLKDGSLSQREAAALQKEQSRIQKAQAEFLKDGTFSSVEQARLAEMQNEASCNISNACDNDELGNPKSASTQRAMDSVQRNIENQRLIAVQSALGLTYEEVADLQNGQSLITRQQSLAMRDGRMRARELTDIIGAQDAQSQNIFENMFNLDKGPYFKLLNPYLDSRSREDLARVVREAMEKKSAEEASDKI